MAVVSACVGLAAAMLSLGAYRLAFGAAGVVLDARPAGVALAILALGLGAAGLRSSQGRSSRGRRAAGATAVVLAVVVGLLLVRDLLFAYRVERVGFSNAAISLSGTLYLPRSGAAPLSAVVITHGAGEETRDEGSFYARAFARNGIAALAYDKRGSGESSGDVTSATYQDFAEDALAAARFLASRPEIDSELIGFKGTSEGSWVVPIAAAAREDTAFVILISATAQTPAEQVRYEVGQRVLRAGFDERSAAKASELYGRLSQFERTGEGREELDAALRRFATEPWFAATEILPARLPPYEEVQRLDWFPAWRSRMDFDAEPYWQSVNCPVLLLLGGKDPKMSSEAAAASIREALVSGGNSDLTVRVFPKGEHGLVEWYLPGRLPPPRFPKGYPDMMARWVLDSLEEGP